jgi:sugar O-acyltransferase (sialic acid O-acetyltransferase NeuD family)
MPTKLTVTRPPDFVEFRKDSINQGIHQRFEEQVRLHSSRVALKARDIALTYSETNGFANSLAEEILSVRGKELGQAAILLPNTTEMVISILASLKAHKAYVPLDHSFPRERLQDMLEHADAAVLLTDDQHLRLAEELCGTRVPIINTSRIDRHPDAPNPNVPCGPLDRAYILYTSGSTGQPKGITFLHRNLLHTTMCLTNELFFAPSDRVTWLHSASFAASVVDIYCCLTNGGTLYPWDAKRQGFAGLADWLVREKVTTFQWIPSAFRQFLRTVPDDFVFNDIRIVVMASEPLTVREVELFRTHFPIGSHLVNQVGTSESYNYRLYPVDHATAVENANVPGGYAVSPDRQVIILDDERREVPPGCVGEIAIKSDYMSAGYWRDEPLTRSKFIQLGGDTVPVFLTGDLGKLEPDGCLIHLGRKDFQVKIRGYRVELAEIDHVLTAAPGVADSATWVVKNQLGEDQLVAYIVPKVLGQFDQHEVEKQLELRLPDYMVPRHYVMLDCLPTLPTGKVDRKGLPNPFERAESPPRPASAEAAPVEEEVAKIFAELLNLESIGLQSDFVKEGGDSLLAAVLLHRIQQRFNVEIPIEEFAESPTPAHLAMFIRAALDGGGARLAHGRPQPRSAEHSRPAALPGSRFQMTHFARPVTVAGADKPAAQASSGIRNLIIIGAGQFGRETFTWAVQAIASGSPWRIKGFLDDNGHALDGYDYPVKILGNVANYKIEADDVFIGAIGDPKTKVRCYSPIAERGGHFINLIHPLANIGNNVQLGVGIVLGPFSSVTCDAKIGHHVSVGAFTNAGHDTVIGDWCQISSHCGINGEVTLAEGVFLGSHACIIPKIKVGAGAFVGAGSVVVRDVQPAVTVFGNPAAPFQKATRSNITNRGSLTILISSAGRRVELIRCFQTDAKALGLSLRMVAVDVEPEMSSACQAADVCFRVPPCTSPDFLSNLLHICGKEKVDLLVPTIDPELSILADHRQRFAAVGTRVLVSDSAVVRMAGDKAATAEFLRQNGIPVPRTARLGELLKKPETWPWPVILKPAHGSASVGIRVAKNIGEAKEAAERRADYVAQELVEGCEYTVNLFFDQAGKLRSAVPHERCEVRAGEVSKGITRREPRLVELAWRLGSVLQGAVGSLCFQAILPDRRQPAVFEINTRFGGGYPLAHQAGATFTRWLLEELAGLPSSANDRWEEGLTMLRYDAAIFRRASADT